MTLADHLPEYLTAIDRRAEMDPDGDYDPIKPEYFERAKAFLVALAEHAPDLKRPTTIIPTADGCVGIEWRESKFYIQVEVAEHVTLLVQDRDNDWRVALHKTINPDCPICREQVVAAVEGSL